MHCALQTQIQRISCYTKLLVVVIGLYLQRSGIRLKGFSYQFETNCHPFERLWPSIQKRNVVRLRGSAYPFEKEMSSLQMTQAI